MYYIVWRALALVVLLILYNPAYIIYIHKIYIVSGLCSVMKRKVIQLAGSTLVVSLPYKWAQKAGVSKGQEVDLSVEGNKVTIIANNGLAAGQAKDVNLSDFGVLSRRAVGALYKSGYDEIKLRFDDPLHLKTIYDVVQSSLIGFEVISEGKNHCILKEISQLNPQDFPNIVRRMFWLLINLSEETAANMVKPEKHVTMQLIERDATLNKFADYARRSLNKGVLSDMRESNLHYYLVEQLERIGDVYKKINRLVLDGKMQRKEIAAHYLQLHEFLALFQKLFYNFDQKDLRSFGKKFIDLQKESEFLFDLCSKHEARVVSLGEQVLSSIHDMNGALMTYHV